MELPGAYSCNTPDHWCCPTHLASFDLIFYLLLGAKIFRKSKCVVTGVFFTGYFSPNFNLKNNMTPTYTKDFSWKKKRPKFIRFSKKRNFKSPDDFYDKFQ
jgi:hypothetical protein